MDDAKTTIDDLKKIMATFVEERDWNQFHTPKDLAMDISIEACELMEMFLWKDSSASFGVVESERAAIEDELADVIMATMGFANVCKLDIASAVERKMVKNRKKYPVSLAKGNSDKYTKYEHEVKDLPRDEDKK